MLGTNGGGFFNANSAHPYENPNAITNLVQMILIFSLGAGLTNLFGRMVGDQRQGWAIFAVMGVLFLAGVATVYSAETQPNPALLPFHIDYSASAHAGRRQYGRQRSPLRNRQFLAVHDRDHGRVLWRGEHHA